MELQETSKIHQFSQLYSILTVQLRYAPVILGFLEQQSHILGLLPKVNFRDNLEN